VNFEVLWGAAITTVAAPEAFFAAETAKKWASTLNVVKFS
jgi:hypothetical protein